MFTRELSVLVSLQRSSQAGYAHGKLCKRMYSNGSHRPAAAAFDQLGSL